MSTSSRDCPDPTVPEAVSAMSERRYSLPSQTEDNLLLANPPKIQPSDLITSPKPTADHASTSTIEDYSEEPGEPPNTSITQPNQVRRHRRNRTSVTPEDLVRFRESILGIPRAAQPNPRPEPEEKEDFSEIHAAAVAFSESLRMDHANNSASSNSNMSPMPRFNSAPSSPSMHSGAPSGMAGMNAAIPMNAGHQMDLNYLCEMINELGGVLKNNRDLTSGIIKSAEEIARRSSEEGATPNMQQVNGELSAARIADLERTLAKEKRRVEILKYEQVENMKLIAEYENAVGTMVEQIRNYCCNNEGHFLAQKREYNDLLQAERDAHLQSRLDRDYWHSQTLRCSEMIRTAYRLRCEEDELPIRIVAGLQNEVRAYRNALGMDPEKPEEEWGWEILKDAPPGVD